MGIIITTLKQYESHTGTVYRVSDNAYTGQLESGISRLIQVRRISNEDAVTWDGAYVPTMRLTALTPDETARAISDGEI